MLTRLAYIASVVLCAIAGVMFVLDLPLSAWGWFAVLGVLLALAPSIIRD